MTADGSTNGWTGEAISFLRQNIPLALRDDGWEHACSSGDQMGCAALVALGQATETDWGAVPRKDARLPDPLPRWDDIATTVVGLAWQRRAVDFRSADGSVWVPPYRQADGGHRHAESPPPSPNIAAAHGLGPARAVPGFLLVLKALGLVDGAGWAAPAEAVLWRVQPRAWALDVTGDARFAEAVARTVATTPDAVRREIGRQVTISDDDVNAALAKAEAWRREFRERTGHGPEFRARTRAEMRLDVALGREDRLDWLFYRGWRLPEGWLTPAEKSRALEIFHDPLARAMRGAVVARLFPGNPVSEAEAARE